MARSGLPAKPKWYGVRCGREGPNVYGSWKETEKQVLRFSCASYKRFGSRQAAERWVLEGVDGPSPLNVPVPPRTPQHRSKKERVAQLSNGENMYPAEGVNRDEQFAKAEIKQENALLRDIRSGLGVDKPAKLNIALVDLEASLARTIADTIQCQEVQLSPEQQQILDMVKSGQNIFFTGSAGTGKSVLLREIINWCRGPGMRHIAVTASTGIAAVNVGGSTLHSWAGIGLGKEEAEILLYKIRAQHKSQRSKGGLGRRQTTVERWRQCQVLVIDEISMVDGKLFDKLEFLARELRNKDQPFGGLQLVICGDFLQLPPVPDMDGKTSLNVPATFAFASKTWMLCMGRPKILRQVFRQKDHAFINLLNAMRLGSITPQMVQMIRSLDRPLQYTDGIEPTDLFPIRDQANAVNTHRLDELPTLLYEYHAEDRRGLDREGYPIPDQIYEKIIDRMIAPPTIALKEGAQVMLIKNLVQGVLVNGSMGLVLGFMTVSEAMTRRPGEPEIHLGYIPHETDPKKFKEDTARREAQKRYEMEMLRVTSSPDKWPVVRFNPFKGCREPLHVICVRNNFEATDARGDIQAVRQQVPLILAWALTMHKSQGQTLERVRVDLGRVFEKGQAYVALSRAVSMEGLEVHNFHPSRINAHRDVLRWMSTHGDIKDMDEEEYWGHVEHIDDSVLAEYNWN